jgi:hypothetical protein
MLGTASGRSVLDPDGGTLIRTGEGLPSIAASPDGSVRVVWADVSSGRSTRILVAKSSDGGRSWSAPATAVRRPVTAFTPVVAAAPSGALAITFYDFRYDRRGDKPLTTDAWIAHSDDGGGRWSTSRLAGPFDLRTAAQTSGGPFLGDYTGLVGVPGGFVSALVQGSPLAPAAGGDVFGIVTRAGTRRPAIRLSVRPGSARRGPRVRLSFLARAKEGRLLRPLLGARVRFGGHTVTTDVRGRASIRIRPRAARYTGHATRPGFRPASATLRTHR